MGTSRNPLSNPAQLRGLAELAKQNLDAGNSEFVIDENTGVKNYDVKNLSKKGTIIRK